MATELAEKMEGGMKVKVTSKAQQENLEERMSVGHIRSSLPGLYYKQKLMLYKGNEFEDIVGKLKDGLGVALEDFYQLAGKLGRDEEGVFRVEYDDDMEGVEVLKAEAEGVSVDDLTFEEGTSALKELIPYNGILNLEGLHKLLLAIQVSAVS